MLHGLGTTDPSTTYGHPYDHPYFGQLLLAGLLKIINYPDSLDLSASIPSSQTLNDRQQRSFVLNQSSSFYSKTIDWLPCYNRYLSYL